MWLCALPGCLLLHWGSRPLPPPPPPAPHPLAPQLESLTLNDVLPGLAELLLPASLTELRVDRVGEGDEDTQGWDELPATCFARLTALRRLTLGTAVPYLLGGAGEPARPGLLRLGGRGPAGSGRYGCWALLAACHCDLWGCVSSRLTQLHCVASPPLPRRPQRRRAPGSRCGPRGGCWSCGCQTAPSRRYQTC